MVKRLEEELANKYSKEQFLLILKPETSKRFSHNKRSDDAQFYNSKPEFDKTKINSEDLGQIYSQTRELLEMKYGEIQKVNYAKKMTEEIKIPNSENKKAKCFDFGHYYASTDSL